MKKSTKVLLLIIGGLFVLIILGVLLTKLATLIVGPDTFEDRLARDKKGEVKDSIRIAQKIEKSIRKGGKGRVKEIRIPMRDIFNIRTGPGDNYPRDKMEKLARGDEIFILDEIGDWVKFRLIPEDTEWSGWVQKDLTVPKQQWDLSKYDVAVKKWMRSGLIVEIQSELTTVLVNASVWKSLDSEQRESIGHSLAIYFILQKKSDTISCVIKDVHSGHTLAEYREGKGFKEYE